MLNPEHKLISFEPAELPRGPWLVFAPHADDETFGMGGSLIKAYEAGIETHVIVLTDGALGGDAENLVAIRRQEVEAATRILGVKSLQCWSEPDRGLTLNPELVTKIEKEILAVAPGSVFFPGPMELHPDHRAAALLVWAALQTLPQDKLPTIFSYEISVQNPANTLIDISAQIETKEKAMVVYTSQNNQNGYPALVSALNVARTFTLPQDVKYAEAFFKYDASNLEISLKESLDMQVNLYL